MIPIFDNFVSLRESDHRYFDKNGQEYTSVSAFKSKFKQPFDSQKMAQICAGKDQYTNMTPQQVQEHWLKYGQDRAEEGTRIHDAIELYLKTSTIKPENTDLTPAILSIIKHYQNYYRLLPEQIIYNTQYKIAGKMDLPCICTNSTKSIIDISDFKTNIKGIEQKKLNKQGAPYNKYMLTPIDHLQESTYNDYSIQLSIYAYMVEQKTNCKIGKLTIHYINPNNPLTNYLIPVPYMKYEVIQMLNS